MCNNLLNLSVMSLAGSFTFIMNMEQNAALIAATVPPTIYVALCFKVKAEIQIQIAAVMSVLYAFLMTGTILSIIGSTFFNILIMDSYDFCFLLDDFYYYIMEVKCQKNK